MSLIQVGWAIQQDFSHFDGLIWGEASITEPGLEFGSSDRLALLGLAIPFAIICIAVWDCVMQCLVEDLEQ